MFHTAKPDLQVGTKVLSFQFQHGHVTNSIQLQETNNVK